jgi:hypothetical protein
MKLFSLEKIAERWTVAHTIATFAWIIVLILGMQLFWRQVSGSYPATSKLKIYAGENATFMYPENWALNNCVADKPFIELPGSIKTDFKGRKAYKLGMEGKVSYRCMENRPERFDVYEEKLVASENPCSPLTSTEGELLKNGLYLQLFERDGKVEGVNIRQNMCYAPADVYVLQFYFVDPNQEGVETEKPAVDKAQFLVSQQYKDIKALGESVRY